MAHDSQIVRAKENLKLSHGGSVPIMALGPKVALSWGYNINIG